MQPESDWRNTTIGDQVLLQRGFDITRATQQPGTVPVVSSGGIASFHNEAMAKGPGVILGRKGVVGSVYYVQDDYWPHDTTLFVKNFGENEPRFVYYFFKHLAPTLARLDVGSANPTLNRNHVHPIRTQWPARKHQTSIAHILGAIDDKIEINRKMNETLEQMARALFKSWFVDFDPVHAKVAGRKPFGMDKNTARLFPDRFEESELGLIPHEWKAVTLGEVLELKRGYDLPAATRTKGSVPIVSSSGPSGWHNQAMARAPGVVTGRYGTIGRVFLVAHDFWPLNTTLYVRDFKDNEVLFAFHLLQQVDFQKYSDKAAVPGINRNHIHLAQVIRPSSDAQRRFTDLAGGWHETQIRRTEEVQALTELRDTLLPRLLSGELRIRDAERIVGEVA